MYYEQKKFVNQIKNSKPLWNKCYNIEESIIGFVSQDFEKANSDSNFSFSGRLASEKNRQPRRSEPSWGIPDDSATW